MALSHFSCVRPNMEYYSTIKENKIFPFATTWMNLEGIMLGKEAGQRKTNTA